ncbi:mechanosensitive ion channel family protein [Haloferax prahovense]|uniref:mechanosensitive ion channel family protein n=1 Tax=Haloferax prahovense TaxID=381852 RepID=UPI003C73799C
MTVLQAGVDGFQVNLLVLGSALAVLVVAYLFARLTSLILSGLAERSTRRRIIIKMFIPIVSFFIYGVAAYLAFSPFLQLSETQLLAVSGFLGVALGFGLKDLFTSVIGGLVIITEKPYQVGDKVTIGDHYGEVTGIGLWTTSLTTPDDSVVRVPNAALFSSNVANANAGQPEMMAVVDVAVAPGTDMDLAAEIMRDALVTSEFVFIDEDHSVVVLIEDQTYYRTIRGKGYVTDHGDEFAFASDVTKRTFSAFDEQGLETPEIPVGTPSVR